MHCRIAAGVAGVLLVASSSLAASEPAGLYVSVYGQISWLDNSQFGLVAPASSVGGLQAGFSTGYGLGGDVGYRYGNGWSAEVEWNYRSHGLSDLKAGGVNLSNDGDFASNTILLNGYRRFPLGSWTPYVGAGIGWVAEIDLDITSAGRETGYSSRNELAFQLIAGAEFALSRHWLFTADARYLRVGGVTLDGPAGTRLEQPDYNPVSVQVGVRYLF
jgi:opacity protein-like surface antigen